MRVSFFISDLKRGGAERVISILADHWAKDTSNEIFIVTLGNSNSSYPLHKNVNLVKLDLVSESRNILEGLTNNFLRVKALRKTFKTISPDVIISFISINNMLSIAATAGLSIPIIISERSNPKTFIPGQPWEFVKKIAYSRADYLILQTKKVCSCYDNYRVKKAVINNPITKLHSSKPIEADKKIILAVGRLGKEKGFDFLIECFSLANTTDWELWIVGKGEEKAALEQQIQRLNLEEKIKLKGLVSNVYDYYKFAEFFILSSNTEGYPNALIEAMSMGKAVISTSCDFGPSEIIEPNVNGILVPVNDKTKMVEGINFLIENESERRKMERNALKINDRLNVDKIAQEWESLIKNII